MSAPRGGRTSDRGFTLVELLVVLAVLALLTALISPVIASLLPGYRLSRVADEMILEIRTAGARAIGTYRTTGFFVDVGDGSYWREGESPTALPAGVATGFVAARSLMPVVDVGQVAFFRTGRRAAGG
ncbi:MAG: prepilin-type N-terminal cleavage/methylation domain-containing protein [Hyphomicrobiales bacterium]|nr:prepilin-type N-terminal cleavage/methylation domain-containing protein [Hyphomicrobiales bacterium]